MFLGCCLFFLSILKVVSVVVVGAGDDRVSIYIYVCI